MASNPTYVFMDIGTTKKKTQNDIDVKITELSMVAVRRDRLLDENYPLIPNTPAVPRVQLKLTLCFNPGRELGYVAKPGGGFTSDDVQTKDLKTFDESCFEVIDSFLNILTEPVYFIAHRGFDFDFPVLKKHMSDIGKTFSRDILCADTYFGFYDILEEKKHKPVEPTVDALAEEMAAKASLEDSSSELKDEDVAAKRRQTNADRMRDQLGFPWGGKENKPTVSYQLSDLHERVLGVKAEDAHKADIDCQLMLRIAVKLADKFVDWVDDNHFSFAEHVTI